jgi:hypothetical protein
MVTLDATVKGKLTLNGVVHTGRLFQIAGKELELFRIGTLAAALDKSTQALILWEKAGLLPKPMYSLTGLAVGHCKRWYAKEQVINLHNLWTLIPYGRGRADLKAAFFTTLNTTRLFYQTRVVTLKTETPHERRQRTPPHRPAHRGAAPRLERAVSRPHR